MVAAERLGRSWIGIDIEPMALSVLQQRFEAERIDVDFEVDGLPSTKAIRHRQLGLRWQFRILSDSSAPQLLKSRVASPGATNKVSA